MRNAECGVRNAERKREDGRIEKRVGEVEPKSKSCAQDRLFWGGCGKRAGAAESSAAGEADLVP